VKIVAEGIPDRRPSSLAYDVSPRRRTLPVGSGRRSRRSACGSRRRSRWMSWCRSAVAADGDLPGLPARLRLSRAATLAGMRESCQNQAQCSNARFARARPLGRPPLARSVAPISRRIAHRPSLRAFARGRKLLVRLRGRRGRPGSSPVPFSPAGTASSPLWDEGGWVRSTGRKTSGSARPSP
jgi:hypothetical protein